MSLPSSWLILVGISTVNEIDNILYFIASTSYLSPSTSLILVAANITHSSYTTLNITSIPFVGMHWYQNELYVLGSDGMRTLNTVTATYSNLIGTYASDSIGVHMYSSTLQSSGLISTTSRLLDGSLQLQGLLTNTLTSGEFSANIPLPSQILIRTGTNMHHMYM
jgi:hypothetical protein